MKLLADSSYAISDEFEIDGEGASHYIFGRGWLLEIIDLDEGDYFFFRDDTEVRPLTGHFGVFYPQHTLVRAFVREVKGSFRGIGSLKTFPELPRTPLIFETNFNGSFTGLEQAFDVLDFGSNSQSIEINTAPSLISVRAKRLLDENYLVYPSISRIAARLHVSPEHLSRQFKRDYGLSPSSYLHQLRVSEATFRLSLGEEIIDIAYDVGYNDLSRFYKQFRKSTQTSPGNCREMLKRSGGY
jgi:AraC-like DNA-binding protein